MALRRYLSIIFSEIAFLSQTCKHLFYDLWVVLAGLLTRSQQQEQQSKGRFNLYFPYYQIYLASRTKEKSSRIHPPPLTGCCSKRAPVISLFINAMINFIVLLSSRRGSGPKIMAHREEKGKWLGFMNYFQASAKLV